MKFFRKSRASESAPETAERAASSPSNPPPSQTEDEPTAPITPFIEMARSPHDRLRDLNIGKGIVKRVDFLDAMITSSAKRKEKETVKQLELLRRDFVELLEQCFVEPFEFAPGTPVSAMMRTRIQIVGGKSREGEQTKIAETVRCGFLYTHADEEEMVLRKAEVTIG